MSLAPCDGRRGRPAAAARFASARASRDARAARVRAARARLGLGREHAERHGLVAARGLEHKPDRVARANESLAVPPLPSSPSSAGRGVLAPSAAVSSVSSWRRRRPPSRHARPVPQPSPSPARSVCAAPRRSLARPAAAAPRYAAGRELEVVRLLLEVDLDDLAWHPLGLPRRHRRRRRCFRPRRPLPTRRATRRSRLGMQLGGLLLLLLRHRLVTAIACSSSSSSSSSALVGSAATAAASSSPSASSSSSVSPAAASSRTIRARSITSHSRLARANDASAAASATRSMRAVRPCMPVASMIAPPVPPSSMMTSWSPCGPSASSA